MKKNEIYRVKIEDLNNLGFGVGRIDGQVIFVGGAVDGDETDVRVILVNKTYAVGRIEKLVTPSPYRQAPLCPVRGCGGCAYQNITYEHELSRKENYVRHAFIKAGLPEAQILPVRATGETAYYRNKAQYAVGRDKDGRATAGFFAPKTHKLIPAAECPLQGKEFPPIVNTVLTFFNENDLPAYEEETHTGLLRHIYCRKNTRGQVLLTLVCNADRIPGEEKLISLLQTRHPEIIGVYLNENREKTNVICSDIYRLLYGEKTLTDTLCGVPLSLSPAAFYQVNHAAAEALYAQAARLAGFTGDESLLDLYCGVGSIGLSMAKQVRELVGIEIVPEAVACAKENAAALGVTNARFFCADAADTRAVCAAVERELGKDYRPDVVVLDPPRKGCDESLLSYLADFLAPRKIVYVSCGPDTLARDAKYLTDRGYTMSAVTPFDLFPRTGHVETVVLMSRA